MKKSLALFSFMTLTLMPLAHSNDVAIKGSLSRLGIHSADVQPSPIAGVKTVLTESGVLCVSVIQGLLYDIGSDRPVNSTNNPSASN